jgi:hypothetical protein
MEVAQVFDSLWLCEEHILKGLFTTQSEDDIQCFHVCKRSPHWLVK